MQQARNTEWVSEPTHADGGYYLIDGKQYTYKEACDLMEEERRIVPTEKGQIVWFPRRTEGGYQAQGPDGDDLQDNGLYEVEEIKLLGKQDMVKLVGHEGYYHVRRFDVVPEVNRIFPRHHTFAFGTFQLAQSVILDEKPGALKNFAFKQGGAYFVSATATGAEVSKQPELADDVFYGLAGLPHVWFHASYLRPRRQGVRDDQITPYNHTQKLWTIEQVETYLRKAKGWRTEYFLTCRMMQFSDCTTHQQIPFEPWQLLGLLSQWQGSKSNGFFVSLWQYQSGGRTEERFILGHRGEHPIMDKPDEWIDETTLDLDWTAI